MDHFSKDIKTFAEQIKELNHRLCEEYRPVTARLCKGQASEREVETVLDEMWESESLE